MKLAIQGHPTRSKEIIALLKMLDGDNPFSNNSEVIGNKVTSCYYISEDTATKYISWDYIGPEEIDKYKIFTLEEFEQKFPYKVGDKVILDTFPCKIESMSWEYDDIIYYVKGVDFSKGVYSKDLQPYKKETIEEINIDRIGFNGDKARLILPDGYEFKAEGNEVFVIKKKSRCPKTYKECCEIIDYHLEGATIIGYEKPLLENLQQLLICRDAYWKIAGEELGLDKPWIPDWKDSSQQKYTIFYYQDEASLSKGPNVNRFLSFPTEEMRYTFYENFKDLIEQCKELV